MRARAVVCGWLIVLGVGCSGGGGSSSTTAPSATTSPPASSAPPTNSAPAATTPATVAPPTIPPTTIPPTTIPPTTIPPVADLPAGMQFDRAATEIDRAINDFGVDELGAFGVGSIANSGIAICPGRPANCQRTATNPLVFLGPSLDALVPTQIDDIATFPKPPGFSVPLGFDAVTVARGAGGLVAGGNVHFWDTYRFLNTTLRAVLWHSADGVEWRRIDLRDIVGDTSVELSSVRAVDGGYIAVGHIAGINLYDGPSRGLVLRSADGLTWTKAAELALPYATELSNVMVVGDRLVISGIEFMCTDDAGAFNDFSAGSQQRLWTSADGGTTWDLLDLTATGVAGEVPAGPTNPADCPDLAGRQALSWGFSLVDDAGGHLVVGAPDLSRLAVTSDLETWTQADWPGAAPVGSTPTGEISPKRFATATDGELVVVSLEALRNANGEPQPFGVQALGWSSVDGGETWERLPSPGPRSYAGFVRVVEGTDGLVRLHETDSDLSGMPLPSYVYVSSAGPLEPWGGCEPAPGADCTFAVFPKGSDFSGESLAGIDLSGAVLVDADFSDADLTGAVFRGASLLGASFARADLTAVSMSGQRLIEVDFTDATLVLADLSRTSLPAGLLRNPSLAQANLEGAEFLFEEGEEVVGVDLSNRNLTNVRFAGPFDGVATFTGVNFSGADLDGATFSHLDLTGADFSGATTNPIYFAADVVCPDGAPPDSSTFGAASCRL